MANLQNLQNELQTMESEAKIRLDLQFIELKKGYDEMKKELEKEKQNYQSLSMRKDIESEEYRKEIAKMV